MLAKQISNAYRSNGTGAGLQRWIARRLPPLPIAARRQIVQPVQPGIVGAVLPGDEEGAQAAQAQRDRADIVVLAPFQARQPRRAGQQARSVRRLVIGVSAAGPVLRLVMVTMLRLVVGMRRGLRLRLLRQIEAEGAGHDAGVRVVAMRALGQRESLGDVGMVGRQIQGGDAGEARLQQRQACGIVVLGGDGGAEGVGGIVPRARPVQRVAQRAGRSRLALFVQVAEQGGRRLRLVAVEQVPGLLPHFLRRGVGGYGVGGGGVGSGRACRDGGVGRPSVGRHRVGWGGIVVVGGHAGRMILGACGGVNVRGWTGAAACDCRCPSLL